MFKALRPHLTEDRFITQVERQFQQAYQITYAADEQDTPAAVMGWRVAEFLAWGKVLYIDDLATLPTQLCKGYASALLDWAENEARGLNCDQVHLDSGYARNDAHRLYLNKGFNLVSHHFSKTLG